MVTRAEIAAEYERRGIPLPSEAQQESQLSETAQVFVSPERRTGTGATIATQAAQGLTFGFADELTTRIAAGAFKLLNPKLTENVSYDDLVQAGLESQRLDIEAQREERPILSIASNIGGGVLTGGAGAATKAGKALGQAFKSGGTATKAAIGAGAGSVAGGLTGLGEAEGSLEERLPEGAVGAGAGAALGAALPIAVPVIKSIKPVAKNTAEAAKRAIGRNKINKISPINSQTVKDASGEAYKRAVESGGVFSPKFTDSFLDEALKISPQTQAGKALGANSKFRQIISNLEDLKGSELDLQSIQEIDEFLGDAADSLLDAGRVTKEASKVIDLQSKLRQLVDDASSDALVGGNEGAKALKEARKLWSAQMRMKDVERIIERAELTDNPATSLRTGMRNLLLNKKRMRGFTPDEVKLIRRAAKTGLGTEALKAMGSRLIPMLVGTGSFAAGGGGLAGGVTGLATALPLIGVSAAARKGAEALQKKQAIKVLRQIQEGALSK